MWQPPVGVEKSTTARMDIAIARSTAFFFSSSEDAQAQATKAALYAVVRLPIERGDIDMPSHSVRRATIPVRVMVRDVAWLYNNERNTHVLATTVQRHDDRVYVHFLDVVRRGLNQGHSTRVHTAIESPEKPSPFCSVQEPARARLRECVTAGDASTPARRWHPREEYVRLDALKRYCDERDTKAHQMWKETLLSPEWLLDQIRTFLRQRASELASPLDPSPVQDAAVQCLFSSRPAHTGEVGTISLWCSIYTVKAESSPSHSKSKKNTGTSYCGQHGHWYKSHISELASMHTRRLAQWRTSLARTSGEQRTVPIVAIRLDDLVRSGLCANAEAAVLKTTEWVLGSRCPDAVEYLFPTMMPRDIRFLISSGLSPPVEASTVSLGCSLSAMTPGQRAIATAALESHVAYTEAWNSYGSTHRQTLLRRACAAEKAVNNGKRRRRRRTCQLSDTEKVDDTPTPKRRSTPPPDGSRSSSSPPLTSPTPSKRKRSRPDISKQAETQYYERYAEGMPAFAVRWCRMDEPRGTFTPFVLPLDTYKEELGAEEEDDEVTVPTPTHRLVPIWMLCLLAHHFEGNAAVRLSHELASPNQVDAQVRRAIHAALATANPQDEVLLWACLSLSEGSLAFCNESILRHLANLDEAIHTINSRLAAVEQLELV